MDSLQNVNKMLEGRTSDHTKQLEKLNVTVGNLSKTKQDKSNF